MPLGGKCFIAYQGALDGDALIDLFGEVQEARLPWQIGAAVPLPLFKPSTASQRLGALEPVTRFALADPATHVLDLPAKKRGRARPYVKYLHLLDPHKKENTQALLDEVLDLQVRCGRKVLISPSLTHGLAAGRKNLNASRRLAVAADSHGLVKGRELLVGLTLHESVLEDEDERNDLLDDLVDEWPERPLFLRVYVPPPESRRQYDKKKMLLGLRDFVRALVANQRRVYLPQNGLAGWLMLPFGASGFGAGISSTSQALAIRPPGRGNRNNWIEWYFLPQFLGFVQRDEVARIAAVDGYRACDCPFCSRLALDSTRGRWDFSTAGLHFLWWCGKLATEASTLTAATRLLADAVAFREAVRARSVILDPRSSPRHLAVWSEVVA